jgi:hypothetical protein
MAKEHDREADEPITFVEGLARESDRSAVILGAARLDVSHAVINTLRGGEIRTAEQLTETEMTLIRYARELGNETLKDANEQIKDSEFFGKLAERTSEAPENPEEAQPA